MRIAFAPPLYDAASHLFARFRFRCDRNYRNLAACVLWPALLCQSPVADAQAPAAVTVIDNFAPKNVILIIGDGMDNQQITIARNYLKGVGGRFTLDTLPQRSIAQVLTVAESNPQEAVYVADSANSATAMASGQVTSRGRIATTAGSDRDLPSIAKLASAAGFKTGLVSTASVTDATMAAFYANIRLRGCENPSLMRHAKKQKRNSADCAADLKANGGPGSIAEQLIDSPLDLVLGGGLRHFQYPAEEHNQLLRARAVAAGFDILTSIEQLESAAPANRWLGLFAAGTLPVTLRGEGNRSAERPRHSLLTLIPGSKGQVILPEPMRCEPNPAFRGTPGLALMTQRALAKLSQTAENGFFLMIESASIDKQAHIRNACGSIGEVEQLDQALALALAYANKNPQTLVIATADHGHAAQLVPNKSLFNSTGTPIDAPGKIVRLKTADDALMVINYATSDAAMEEHTGVSVPVLTNHSKRLPTTLMQTDLFELMADHLGLSVAGRRIANANEDPD